MLTLTEDPPRTVRCGVKASKTLAILSLTSLPYDAVLTYSKKILIAFIGAATRPKMGRLTRRGVLPMIPTTL